VDNEKGSTTPGYILWFKRFLAQSFTDQKKCVKLLSSLSISQDQMVSYSTYVPSGKTAFILNLYWGVTSNSLSLTVNAPDSTPGPYYDAADGQVDGRINLRFSKSGGIASGPRKSCIYGHAVNGAQRYMNTTTST
jgi:hypothetical protein